MNNFFKTLLGLTLTASLLIFNVSFSQNNTIKPLPTLKPDEIHSVVATRVTNFFTQSHYKYIELNDEFSEKIYDRYIKLLDSNRALLTQKEIDSFKKKSANLVKELNEGKLDTAFEIYNFALKKRYKRYQYSIRELQKPFDFEQNDVINIDREDISWPKSESELDTYWQKRVKYDALNLALTDKKDDEIRETLKKRYQRVLRTLTQTKPEDAFQIFMNAFAREIDPHTSYLSPRVKRSFDSEMSLSLEGIGATLTQDEDYTKIVSLITGGPAEKSKLLNPDDKIIGVGQKEGPIEEVIGWRLDDVVDKIRGPKDTPVRLEIISKDVSTPKIITIIRDKIHIEDQEAKLSIKMTKRGDVGVITIPNFYFGLTEKVKLLINEVNMKRLTGIVFDLRNNGGGSLTEVISLTGLFIEKGPVVQVKDNVQNLSVHSVPFNRHYYKGPIVVMVNRNSASASEIFAAALQDYGRAIIIGEDTFGKGTVQTSHGIAYQSDAYMHPSWPELGGIQYTIQKFYCINGDSTQLKGVTPDILMGGLEYNYKSGEKYLDNALPWDSVKKTNYRHYYNMNEIIPTLTQKHLDRIKDDPEFNYIKQDIESYNNNKDMQYIVSLNKTIRKNELDKNEKESLTRMQARLNISHLEQLSKLSELSKNYKVPDAYYDEAVEVLLDLSTLYLK